MFRKYWRFSSFDVAEDAKDGGKLEGSQKLEALLPPPASPHLILPPLCLAPAGVGQTSLGAGEETLSSRLAPPADTGAPSAASPWICGLKEPLGLSFWSRCFSLGWPQKVSTASPHFHFFIFLLPEEMAGVRAAQTRRGSPLPGHSGWHGTPGSVVFRSTFGQFQILSC